jgi:rhodanese-related sulfurtransferase
VSRRRRWPWIVLAIIALAGSCVALGLLVRNPTPDELQPAIRAQFPNVEWIGTDALAALLEAEGRAPVLLDARTPSEHRISHLLGARRIDPDTTDFTALELSPDASIVVYCAVGYRSGAIADRMQRAGFGNVRNLTGGIFQWANEGRAIYRGRDRAWVVHPFAETWGRFLRPDVRGEVTGQ